MRCTLDSKHSDCILFKAGKTGKKRLLQPCYNYKSLICLSTCPTGYIEDEGSGNCTLQATFPFDILFHAPNSYEFLDPTETIIFTASQKLNAYQRGMHFNSTYGKLEGNQVQISPDFELFLLYFQGL